MSTVNRVRACLILLVLAAPLVVAPSASPTRGTASALPTWVWFHPKGSTCALDQAGLPRVTTKFLMGTRNHSGPLHWVTNFRLQIRLEDATTGLKLGSSWHSVRFPGPGAPTNNLLQDKTTTATLWVTSDNNNMDSIVHIKLIWDQTIPYPDLVQHIRFPLSKLKCKKGSNITFQ